MRRLSRPRVRSGPQRLARALSWVLVLTSTLVVVTSVGGYAYVQHLSAQITHLPLPVPDTDRPRATADVNVLLAGVDTRDGQDPAFQASGAAHVTGSRPDSMLLVHLAATGPVTVVSFPRDSYVQIPAYTSPSGQAFATRRDKLNSAGSEGGPGLLVQTVEQLSGLRVDHYVQVDFGQFQTIVDALGGVDVCLTQPAHDTETGISLSAGDHTLTGAQALQYVRQRYNLPLGDLDRIGRQQRFASSVLRKLTSAGTLLDPVRLNSFLVSVTKSLTVDDGTSLDDLVTLGERVAAAGVGGVSFVTLPVSDPGRKIDGSQVVILDAPATTALFQRVHDDAAPAAPSPSAPSPSAPSPSAPSPSAPPPSASAAVSAATATCGV